MHVLKGYVRGWDYTTFASARQKARSTSISARRPAWNVLVREVVHSDGPPWIHGVAVGNAIAVTMSIGGMMIPMNAFFIV